MITATFSGAVLFGTRAADRDGIHGLKVTGIRYQMNMKFGAAASGVLSRGSHVIFHIAAAKNAARINIFEPGKDFFGRTASNVHHYVQPPAVAHPHHQFNRSVLTCAFENLIHQGY